MFARVKECLRWAILPAHAVGMTSRDNSTEGLVRGLEQPVLGSVRRLLIKHRDEILLVKRGSVGLCHASTTTYLILTLNCPRFLRWSLEH